MTNMDWRVFIVAGRIRITSSPKFGYTLPMRNHVPVFFLLASLLLSCGTRTTSSNAAPAIALTDCVLSSPDVSYQVPAKCGALTVLENPSDPQGRTLSLNVAVVPAIKRTAEPDPLFILVGGPGQSAVENFPVLFNSLFAVHERRDIVAVDQRGTGKSNPLRCLDPEDEALDDAQILAALKECPNKLDADLRYYGTEIAMQDLDQVRSALGYSSVNLYGVSYGTRAALTYLKMYPERVRSVTLDSALDPAFVLYQDAAQDGQSALDFVLSRCEKDKDCASAYPNVRLELDSILRDLDAEPAEISIPHPTTGRPLQLTITKPFFTNIIFSVLYSSSLVALLPFSIHQAYAEKNYAPLIAQSHLLNRSIYDGMFHAVTCAEDAPLLSPAQASADDASIFGGRALEFIEVCKSWTKGDASPILRAPVSSNVPILILSGEADPITPPRHIERITQSLPNSLHLIFNGMGHGNVTNDCAAKILDAFIESASIRDLDTACVEHVAPPPFFVDFSGPHP